MTERRPFRVAGCAALAQILRDNPPTREAVGRANRRVAADLFGVVSGPPDEAPGMTLQELLGDIDTLIGDDT